IKTIRYYASSNNIDEQSVFDELVKTVDEKISYHNEHIDEKIDKAKLIKFFSSLGATAAGFGIVCSTFKYQDILEKFFHCKGENISTAAILGAMIPLYFIVKSITSFSLWVNHKKKIIQLGLIKEGIQEALCKPFV